MKLIRRAVSTVITPLILSMTLAACGGGGGSTASPAVPPVASKPAVMFVADSGNQTLARLSTFTPATGDLLSAAVLRSSENYSVDIAYDAARDRLYAASFASHIAVFDNASALTGQITPTRTIIPVLPPAQAPAFSYLGLQLDKEHDRLYVSMFRNRGASLAVFDNASTLSGQVTPSRLISMPGSDFVVDTTRGIIYFAASDNGVPAVRAYADVDRLNGTLPEVAPQRLSLTSGSILDMAIDAGRDRMYLTVQNAGLAIVGSASSALRSGANQSTAATVLVSLPASNVAAGGVAIDAVRDRVYVGLDERVYLFNGASSLTAGTSNNTLQINAPAGSRVSGFAF